MSSVMSLQEENRVLQGELARLEDLLAHSRADRDELAIKYGAISERVRQQARVCEKETEHFPVILIQEVRKPQVILSVSRPPFKRVWGFFV